MQKQNRRVARACEFPRFLSKTTPPGTKTTPTATFHTPPPPPQLLAEPTNNCHKLCPLARAAGIQQCTHAEGRVGVGGWATLQVERTSDSLAGRSRERRGAKPCTVDTKNELPPRPSPALF